MWNETAPTCEKITCPDLPSPPTNGRLVRVDDTCDGSVSLVRVDDTCDGSVSLVRVDDTCDGSVSLVRVDDSCDMVR